MDKLPITKVGEKNLTEKLRQLKTKDRPEISKAIAEARAHGDLKENAEYHAAKEQQGFIEAKIQEIEHALANAQVIDVKDIPETGRVVFGATIDLYDWKISVPFCKVILNWLAIGLPDLKLLKFST